MNLDDYMKLQYLSVVTNDEYTDGTPCYFAENPELPGCMSDGLTYEQAITTLAEARRLYIQSLLGMGIEVPIPICLTLTSSTVSGSTSTVVIPATESSPIKQYDVKEQAPVESLSCGIVCTL